jgi:hypothetical protein
VQKFIGTSCAPLALFQQNSEYFMKFTSLARKATPMNDDHTTGTSSPSKQAGSKVGSVAFDVRAAASKKIDQAVTEVRAKADGTKADLANEVKDVATALRRASEELRGGSAQERTLGQISSSLADASDAIRDKDLGEILRSVSKVARDHPMLFLGGAALLGFAASRYAKASGGQPPQTSTRDSMDPAEQVKDFVDEGNPNTQPVGEAT